MRDKEQETTQHDVIIDGVLFVVENLDRNYCFVASRLIRLCTPSAC